MMCSIYFQASHSQWPLAILAECHVTPGHELRDTGGDFFPLISLSDSVPLPLTSYSLPLSCAVASLSRPGVLVAYTLLRATGGCSSGSYLGTIWDIFGGSLGITCQVKSNQWNVPYFASHESIATPDAVKSGPTPPCNIKAVPSACIEMQPTKVEGNSRIVFFRAEAILSLINCFDFCFVY